MDVAVLLLAGSATALATGLGVFPLAWVRADSLGWRAALTGATAGLMGVASVVGLILPGLDEGSSLAVALGFVAGVLFLVGTRTVLGHQDVHIGELRGVGVRRSVLVFLVLFVHSLPEGMAIGTAYASETEGLSLFIILAIALQNVPEGTSVAIPMQAAGFSRTQQFWAAVGTSVPQPLGALGAYLLVAQAEALLPFSFGLAAGAMLALVAVELVPDAFRRGTRAAASVGAAGGAALMLALAALLGV